MPDTDSVDKWQITPTRDNYALIPDYMKPTPAQRLIPHTSEIDYVIMYDSVTAFAMSGSH